MLFKSLLPFLVLSLVIYIAKAGLPAASGQVQVKCKCEVSNKKRMSTDINDVLNPCITLLYYHLVIRNISPSIDPLLSIHTWVDINVKYVNKCDAPTSQTASHSKLPRTTVTCHSGTMFNDCCSAKTPKAATCTGLLVKKPSPQSPVLLGSTGGPAPMNACLSMRVTCAPGFSCVYISGGLLRDPICTCNTDADCIAPTHHCRVFTPTMPKNYKGTVCMYK